LRIIKLIPGLVLVAVVAVEDGRVS
jgi:hypothetical protein